MSSVAGEVELREAKEKLATKQKSKFLGLNKISKRNLSPDLFICSLGLTYLNSTHIRAGWS